MGQILWVQLGSRSLLHICKTRGHKVLFLSFLTQNMQQKFIPEHTTHFGGLWKAAMKSIKTHLRCIVGNVKLIFEEFTTVLAQVESCLNSRPLVSLPLDNDGIGALTPRNFLIGRPLKVLPDPSFSYCSLTLLYR